eukprot:9213751-Pyramimonas_sp.AAC.1
MPYRCGRSHSGRPISPGAREMPQAWESARGNACTSSADDIRPMCEAMAAYHRLGCATGGRTSCTVPSHDHARSSSAAVIRP